MATLDPASPDYPFYRDKPSPMTALDWTWVWLALVVGFALLTHVPHLSALGLPLDGLLRAILFGAVPLGVFAWRAGPSWTAIFRGWRWSYLGWGLFFGAINLILSTAIGILVSQRMELAGNGAVMSLRRGEVPGGPAMFYLDTGIQLLGEEVFTILPFLFLLWLGVQKCGMQRRKAVLLAWIGSSLLFGAIHLPTYEWNVGQAMLLLAPVRLVLTLAYIKTKSMWTSTIAHVFNDWTMFTLLVVVGARA